MTIEELKSAIKEHDFSFQYSDDHRAWKKGQAELDYIKRLSVGIEPKIILEIWNNEVGIQFSDNTFKINLERAAEWSSGE